MARLSHALEQLRREIDAAHPGRSKISDGWIGDPAHQARTSDHNPDPDGIVHAIDVTVWDGPDPDTADDVAAPLAAFLLAARDPRTKYVIHRGRMFASYTTATRPAWTWGPYTGPNGHFHHVHVSCYGDDGHPWGYPAPDHQEFFDMDEATLTRILDDRIGRALDARLDPDNKGNLLVRIRNSAALTEQRVKRLLERG